MEVFFYSPPTLGAWNTNGGNFLELSPKQTLFKVVHELLLPVLKLIYVGVKDLSTVQEISSFSG